MVRLRFHWVREDLPGPKWTELHRSTWAAYREWYLQDGAEDRPPLELCRAKLREWMPELVPTWERLVALAGGDELTARMLSLYRPPAYLSGCSQAVWSRETPVLVRNYDYHPACCEGLFLRSAWHGTPVLASSDCLWGALDGINARGLAVALAYGGSTAVGDGFGIPLIMRYVLELCGTVEEAVAVLGRVPSHMAYNISLLDASGRRAVVRIAPDSEAALFEDDVEANDPRNGEPTEYGTFTKSAERRRTMEDLLRQPAGTLAELIDAFLRPPLHTDRYAKAVGTIYTVAYGPRAGSATYRWPSGSVDQTLAGFAERELELRFPG